MFLPSKNRQNCTKLTLEELKLFFYWCLGLYMYIELSQQSSGFWSEFYKFLKKSKTGAIFIIDTLTFIKNRDELIIIRNYSGLINMQSIHLNKENKWHSGFFKSWNALNAKLLDNKNLLCVPIDLYKEGLYVRSWQYGDRMVSSTSGSNVLISDIFINNKLSKYDKLIQPLLVDNNDNILWIPGLMHGNINFQKKSEIKRIIEWARA